MAAPSSFFVSQNPVEMGQQTLDTTVTLQALAEAAALQGLRQVLPERTGALALTDTCTLPVMKDLPRRVPDKDGGDIEKDIKREKGGSGDSGDGDSSKKKEDS